MPAASLILFAVATGSLLFAFVAEHFLGIQPCILCIYQRIPYALVMLVALLAFIVRGNDKRARCLLGIAALAFFVNVGIAFFHSGVELHWWAGTDTCAVNPDVMKDVAAARDMLLKTPTVRCDEINFTFFGLTMANWNVLGSFGLGVFALLASLGPCINWCATGCCTQKRKN